MSAPRRILLIDDNPFDRGLIRRVLFAEFPDLLVEDVETAEQFARALEVGGFDAVLTDYLMPWTDGLAVLARLRARWPDCPVVMVTGSGNEEIAVAAIKAGLDDYVLKSPKHLGRLPAALQSAWEHSRQRRALQAAETQYRVLFDSVPVGLFRSTPEGQFLDANLAQVQMLGFPDRAALLGVDTPAVYLYPEDRRKWQARLERDGVVRDFEVQLRRRDGSIIWVRTSTRAVRGADGRILYYEGAAENITQRKRAEAEIQGLARFPAENPNPVLRLDRAGVLRYANDASRALLSEWGCGVGDPAPPEWRTRVAEALGSGARRTLDLRWAGRVYTVEVVPFAEAGYVNLYGTDITSRQRAEEALASSQRTIAALVSHLPGMAYRCRNDRERTLELVSDGCLPLSGYPPADLLHNARVSYAELIHPEDREAAWLQIQAALGDGRPFEMVYRIRTATGGEKWVWEQGHGIPGADGALQGLEGFIVDISARKRAEEALAARTQQLEAVRTVTVEIGRELDLSRVLDLIHRRAAELLGVDAGVIYLWDEQDRVLIPHAWGGLGDWMRGVRLRPGEAVAGAVAGQREGLIVNDYQASAYAHPLFQGRSNATAVMAEPLLCHDRLVGVIAIVDRGSGRVFAEADGHILKLFAAQAAIAIENARLFGEVSRAQAEWQGTFDAAADLIAVLDPDLRIVRVNRALAQKLGAAPEALMGRPGYEALEGYLAPRPDGALARCLRSRQSVTEEWGSAGDEEWYLRTYSPFFDAAGRLVGVILISKDVTAQKVLQQQLLHSEKMAAMGRLVSGVAHELNNPLAAVFGHAQLLLLGTSDGSTRERAEVIAAEADRAARIVRNLLSFARPQKPERKSLDLSTLIEETLSLRSYELSVRNISVVKALAPDLPPVLGDPHQLQQVCLNLLINAEQAIEQSASHGEIRISTTADPDRSHVRVRVEDTGPGIPAGILDRIFDPFFTTKEIGKGTGLGLSICYTILEEHGGRIDAASRPEGGARFELELPACVEGGAGAGPVRPSSPDRYASRGKRVLVADDEEAVARVVAGALGMEGHQVDIVLNGRAAAERLRRETYDLVLMDLKMPELDGEQLYQEIAARKTVRPHVVIMTGDTVSHETRDFLARTGLPCIEKPFKLEDIWRCVAQLDGGPPGPGEGRPGSPPEPRLPPA